jgi:hypothetical protein
MSVRAIEVDIDAIRGDFKQDIRTTPRTCDCRFHCFAGLV